MASSSSSSSSCQYDVFLSFRGEDTRDNFTSHLYAALCRKKIKTFIDDEGLRRGDDISPALLNAIECSKISVIIFSKDYAFSKWCLDELIKILQCHQMNGQIVIPVFYRVDPSDVRKQNGSFGDAFVAHDKRFKDMPEKIQKWRAVLTQAANLSGWASKEIRSEAELVELIVNDVLKKLENVTGSTYLDGFVGLNSRVEEIKSLLCFGSPDIRIVGIWGMGGIGKTTIAGVIFNQYSREFEGKCFLANVRDETEKGGGLVYLRKQILSEILEENIKINTPDLPEYIKGRLRQMKVLIVLDDVNTVMQLIYLAGGIDGFGPGSRIIITTRDRRVLDNFGVCDTNIYNVRGLEYHDALELFCTCAFKEKHCPSDLSTLSESVLRYANGNPLALKVLGSFFHQKSKSDLEASLEYLNQISNPDIFDILKISYNDLQQEVKSIFLDIACFFVGEHKDFLTRILDSSKFADYGLNVLIEKSLVVVSSNDQVQMHDLLQEMGREIVRQECVKEPGKRSRLWHHEDIYHVLKKNKGTDAIEGIFLNLSKIRDIHLASRAFVNMSNLRLLKFYMPEFRGVPIMCSKVHLNQDLEYLPDELRYLHWHSYPLKLLPSNFEPENLIALSLPYSEVDKIWEGDKKAPKLTFIDLHHSRHLTKMPELLEFQNIIKLKLSETAIEEIPSSIEFLTSLNELHLRNCTRLKRLPSSISKLKSLLQLNLRGSKGLGSSLPLLSSLSTLISLNLSDCAVMEIPQDIGRLSSLVDLELSKNNLKSLPVSIGCLSMLYSLDLYENNLESLPTSIGCLSSLVNLDMRGNNFEGLPASMKQLSQLEYLCLSNCNKLQSLPELPLSLSVLRACNCKQLQSLPKNPSSPEEIDAYIRKGSYVLGKVFTFINCSKLNGNANNFLEDSQRIIQHMAIAPLPKQETYVASTLCLPGWKIPDWITNQSLFNSVTIQLPLDCGDSNFIGFFVCVVIGGLDASDVYTFVKCDYCFEIITPSETKHVRDNSIFNVGEDELFDSEHILLGFSPCWDVGLPDVDHKTTVSFQFSLNSLAEGKSVTIDNKLRSCGVCPVYLSANEMKPNSLILKFAADSDGECSEIRNLDDKASTSGASAIVGKADEEEIEPSSKKICREQL